MGSDVRRIGTVVVLLVGLGLIPQFLGSYHLFIATRTLIMVLFVIALNVVFGYGGMPSLGHAAFFGLGGYAVGLGVTRWSWDFGTVLLVGVGLGLLVGLLMGILTLKTEGIYLLLLTFAMAESVWALAFDQVKLTRGDNGIAGITRETIPLGLTTSTGFYYFVLVTSLIVIGLLWGFIRSPVGRVLVGARESKSRMEALGYRVGFYRVGAFAVSGAASALAGVLLVYLQGIVTPEVLNWPLSATVLLMAILGGAGSFFGPAIGAVVVIGLQEGVSTFTERWTMVLGAVFILTMLLVPSGLTGLLGRRSRSASSADAGPASRPQRDGEVPMEVLDG